MQRISDALQSNGVKVNWYSRSYMKNAYSGDWIIETKFKSGPLFYLEYNYRLFKALMAKDVDIISSVDLDTLVACALAARKKKCKLVFDAHEIFYEVPELHGKPIRKWIWKKVAQWGIPKTDAAYTVNDSLKKHHEKAYEQKFDVIRNVPIENKGFSPQNNFSKKQLVYLGVLNKGRGIEWAIESLKELKDYSLLLIGDGDIKNELESLAEKLEVSDRVSFVGYQNPDKIQQLLQDCSIGLNVLEGYSENYRLSLANKFFDYMHAGLPSLNVSYPEYKSINEKHEVSILLHETNVNALVSAVRSLEDEGTYNRLHENCLIYKSLYSWQNEKEKLQGIYNSL